ncbi:MAG: cytochrome c oxidase subunit 2 [Arenicella sp.]|jgi:cytochrome c oxidase subunit 2
MVIFNLVLIKCRFRMTVIALSLLSISISAIAIASDTGAGKDIYTSTCVACHGIAADGNDAVGAPALAGQHQSYLARQLANYNQAIRGSDKADRYGQQMVAMATLVKTPESQANVSAYLASLDKPITSVTSEKTGGGNSLGYKVYQASCGACHGSDASGNERLNSPSLAGLSSAYLTRQYANFMDGKRGVHSTDKYGRQMNMIAKTVTEPEKIDAVIAYIVSLQD